MGEVNSVTVVKVIELIGTSPKSWSEAAQNAVTEAAMTIKNIKAIHVKHCTGKIKNNKIVEYNTNVKIVFVVDRKEAM
jgi:flavin-binding protein dodecin